MRAWRLVASILIVSLVLWPVLPVHAQSLSDVWVDDDYCSTCRNDGHQWKVNAFATISDGLRAVAPGGRVHVYPGRYEEDVVIERPVSLLAEASGATLTPRRAEVTLTVAANNVAVEGLEVIGGRQAAILVMGPDFQRQPIRSVALRRNAVHGGLFGIAVNIDEAWNYGTVAATDIEISDNAISGCTRALYVYNARADITDNNISDLQPEGIGIYSSQGSVSRIKGNSVLVHSPNSRGICVLDNKGTLIDGNSLHGSSDVLTPTTAITLYGYEDLVLSNNAVRGFYWGADAYTGGTARVERNTFLGTAAWALSFGTAITQTKVTIVDNSIRGSYWGLRLDDDGGYGLQATVQGNNFSDNVVGTHLASTIAAGQVRLHGNAFCSNLSAGLRNESEARVLATDNWWGANDGPGPLGSGDRVEGAGGADVRPWIRLTASAGTQADGRATITAVLAGQHYRLNGFGLTFRADRGAFADSSSSSWTALTDAYGEARAALDLAAGQRARVTISSACGPILTLNLSQGTPSPPLPFRLPPALH